MLGIFDSGSGGLSVLKAIREKAPQIDILYFGDIARAPYGNKKREELGVLTALGFHELLSHGANHVVSACNSVSASITEPLLSALGINDVDIIEMVQPTVRALSSGTYKRISVLATKATVDSRMYQKEFEKVGITVDAYAVPDLAGAIEFGESEEKISAIIKNALALVAQDTEVVVLACTHFPLYKEMFIEGLHTQGLHAKLFDPAIAVAEEVIAKFGQDGSGETKFFLTKDSELFRKRAAELGGSFTIEIV